jgi:hypothetical protein
VASTVERDPASGAKQIHIANEPNKYRPRDLLDRLDLSRAQDARSRPPAGVEAQKCAALIEMDLETAPGPPAVITSARLVEVPVFTPVQRGSSSTDSR